MNYNIAKNYGWKSSESEHSHQYLIPSVLSYLKRYKAISMLDIGTGNGSTIPYWLSEGIQVAAMEPDNEGFCFASKHEMADVRCLGVGDILPQEWERSFDVVLSLEVIEHLFDPAQLVKAAGYAVKDDGVVIISTPYHGYLKNLALSFAGKWDFHHHPCRIGGHIKYWSRATLSQLFASEGFVPYSFKGVGRLPYIWKSMIMVFKKSNLS